MSNWVVRFADDAQQSREDLTAAVTKILAAAGYRVLSVAPPLELNPQPLRVRLQVRPTLKRRPEDDRRD